MPTLTVQPSAKDTYIRVDAPNNNYGSLTTLDIYDGAGQIFRSILEFALSELPVGATITSATLQLYYFTYAGWGANPSGLTAWAYKLTRADWVEAQATWNAYKTGSSWTTPGGDYVTANPSGGSTTFPASPGAWMSWNVLAIVQDAYAASNPAEFLIKFATEPASGSYVQFYSKEEATQTTLRPKLVIEYVVGPLSINPITIPSDEAVGTPKLSLSIYPSTIASEEVVGSPTIATAGTFIYPATIPSAEVVGTPALLYPQFLAPPTIPSAEVVGTPSLGFIGFIMPVTIPSAEAVGMPTILKYVWHVILDGNYLTESPETNRTFVIGRDQYGNPVWGEAHDTAESALVGERLDFTQELAIPTTAQAAAAADAILSKMRLTKARGVILIPPNCGQELFDTVQLSDAMANQSAVKFRVVGIRFEYNPKQARYHHKLILGAP